MLDPLKNAKVVAVFYFISALLTLLTSLSVLIFNPSLFFFNLGLIALGLVVGYGLFTSKRWGVYALGANGVMLMLHFIYIYFRDTRVDSLLLLEGVVTLVLFAWFYKHKLLFK